MSLSTAEICAVLAEIRPSLLGGRVQKVAQPTETSLMIEVRTPGRTVPVLLSVQPETARLHVQTARLPNPPTPPAFCQLLRARLQGAYVADLQQLNEDRIVEWTFVSGDHRYGLVAELFGRAANIVLVDEQRIVIGALRPAADRLRKPLDRPRPAGPPTRPPVHHRSRLTSAQEPTAEQPFPLSAVIEETYGSREIEAIAAAAQQQRRTVLRREMKQLLRRIDGLSADLEKAQRYEGYARYGELLKANLGAMTKGASETEVVDYFDEALPTLTLPLDPAKSPQANMDDYFQKHRKFLTAQRLITPRLAAAREALSRAQEEWHRLEAGIWTPPTSPTSHTVRGGTRTQAPKRQGQAPAERKGPFRRFHSHDGLPIYVGRNARENEDLTHRFANSEDLWLHARGVPGSHVVVRLPKGADVPQETLRDAATLALLYSDLKKSGKGDVIYTRKKWVKKAKGQATGAVVVTQERTIHAQVDRERLTRIKERTAERERADD
ncbi:MAG: NFACT family protein [Nitrospiraceae bacterium]